ncbi:hypothetical protein LI088_11770, partial [Adlercreutzia equolifaciens]|nr:hypothetical protein [Adlercreutzia equolifaciens]MCB6977283.1 hypothetical protein [Adlercreutzia equolifaciens]
AEGVAAQGDDSGLAVALFIWHRILLTCWPHHEKYAGWFGTKAILRTYFIERHVGAKDKIGFIFTATTPNPP